MVSTPSVVCYDSIRYEEVREAYRLCGTDPVALREFFLRYRYLNVNDLAQILGVCTDTVRIRRRRAGFACSGWVRAPKRQPEVHIEMIPGDPKTRDWWVRAYAKYGRRKLARLLGVSPLAILYRLRNRGIQLRSMRDGTHPTHPCCNEQWLLKHYVEQRLTATQCGRLAGVSNTTIANWLNRYCIARHSQGQRPVVGKADSL